MVQRILVIDDEFTNVRVLQLVLEDAGYQVLSAWNGQEGLKVLAEQPVDLILCDVVMPIMDGPQFCRAVQAQAVSPAPPIILMSGTSAPPENDSYPYAAFLKKPFHLGNLLDVVRSRIGSADGSS